MIENFENFSNPADIVFRSEVLVRRIIDFLTLENDSFQHLDSRRISKSFNSEFLRLIRHSHKNLEIELKTNYDKDEMEIFINGQLTTPKESEKCYRFLRNVASIQIEKVHFSEESSYPTSAKYHELIMNQLYLTNEKPIRFLTSEREVCSAYTSELSCISCRKAVLSCQDYGPMSMDVLLNAFDQPHHFETLRITDHLLQLIARECTRSTESEEECISKMKKYINPNISCDVLNLKLFVMDWNMGNIPHAQPREIIDEMCKVWRVKRIELKFVKNEYRNVSRAWRWPKKYFKPWEFIKNPSYNPVATESSSEVEQKIETVIVDGKWSEKEYEYREHWSEPYLYLFANLIRIFPSSKDIFVIRDLKKDVWIPLEEILMNLVKNAWLECPDNCENRLFIRLKYSHFNIQEEQHNDILGVHGPFIGGFELSPANSEISEKFKNWQNVLNDFDSKDIRKQFTLKNNSSKKQIHFELVHSPETLGLARQNIASPFQILFYFKLFI